jgi:CBS domain-containing protein
MAVRTKPRTVCAGVDAAGRTHHEANIVISLDVGDHMASKLVTLDPDADILAAAHTLIKHDISGAPVVDRNGQMVGILTERDCMRAALQAHYYGTPGGRVREFMSAEVKSVAPAESILTVAKMFIEGSYNRYPVVENGRLVGQISRRDVMRALGKQYPLKARS